MTESRLKNQILWALSRQFDHLDRHNWLHAAEIVRSVAESEPMGSAFLGRSVDSIYEHLVLLLDEGLIKKASDSPMRSNTFQLTDQGFKAYLLLKKGESDFTDSVDSSNWTGIPSVGHVERKNVDCICRELSNIEKALDSFGASNEEKAQARAYIIAIKALAEAPNPPSDLIWELVSRANSLAGVASLFVSILALVTASSH